MSTSRDRTFTFTPIDRSTIVFPGTLVLVKREHIKLTSHFGAEGIFATKSTGDAYVNETAIVLHQHGSGSAYPELLVLTEKGILGWHDSDSFGILRHGW